MIGKLLQWHINWLRPAFDKGGAPSAPAAPDPRVQIAAQAKALPSYVGPTGSSTYSGDPTAGTFKLTQTLSPEQQALYENRTAIAKALSGNAESTAGSMSPSFQFNGATDPGTNQYFQAEKALLDPVWNQDQERERQRLVNQGIPEGSDAYNQAMDQFQRQKDAAYQQAAAGALTQGYNQALSTRQQNVNEIANAMGSTPTVPSPGAPIDTSTPFASQQAGKNLQYQSDLAGYNAGVAGQNNAMGAAATVAAAFI